MSIIQRAKLFGLKTLIQFGGRDKVRDMAQKWLNEKVLRPYGTLLQLEIHPGERTIEAELELKGETEPLRVTLSGYTFTENDGQWFMEVRQIKTSRAWINTLLSEPFVQGEIKALLLANPVPEVVRTLLE